MPDAKCIWPETSFSKITRWSKASWQWISTYRNSDSELWLTAEEMFAMLNRQKKEILDDFKYSGGNLCGL